MKMQVIRGAGSAINISSMKYTLSDKIIAYLALLSGLTISAVAVWYSVAGLVAIFAASAMSIIIMGVALEVSKLVATVWLKWNWKRAPRLIKIYLIIAIAILMLITSMGIFGYLSKAHLDQNIVSGDVQSKISLIDEKIRTERDNIEAAKKALAQMDSQVDQVLGRTDDARGAERAVQIRRNQAKERTALQNDIAKSQAAIAKLNEEAAPIRAEVRKVEAEVGPIKYIAKLIYGDNPDANILEKAVTWVIIIIVLVFDPLAVILLLASQYSFQWFRQEKERNDELVQETTPQERTGEETSVPLQPYSGESDAGSSEQRTEDPRVEERDLSDEANEKIAEIDREIDIDVTLASLPEEPQEKDPLSEWNEMIEEAEKAAVEEIQKEDDEIIDAAPDTEKAAMKSWKQDNPDSSLKHQRKLLERGVIDRLPWEEYLRPQADYEADEAALEAAKWAQEQIEKKKELTYVDKEGKNQVIRSVEYQQNAEQNSETLWAKLKDKKSDNDQ